MTNDETKSESPVRHPYPRSHRLSGKIAFSSVYDAKVKESRGPLAMYSLPNGLAHLRFGASVPKRLGSAPVRNRVKRLLREAFRAHQFDLPRGYDLVIAVRPHEPLPLAKYLELMENLMAKSHAAWLRRS